MDRGGRPNRRVPLRCGPVAGAVVVDEGRHPHDREAWELGPEPVVVEPRVPEHARWMAVDQEVGAPEPGAELVAVGADPEVEAVALLARVRGGRAVGTDRAGRGARPARRARRGRRARARRAGWPTRCRARPRWCRRDRRGRRRGRGRATGRLAPRPRPPEQPRRGLGVDRVRCQRREVGERRARWRDRCTERHRHIGERRPRGGRAGVDPTVGGAQEHGVCRARADPAPNARGGRRPTRASVGTGRPSRPASATRARSAIAAPARDAQPAFIRR